MVRLLKYTKAFFRLIRLPNLIIIAFTMLLLRWFVVLPILHTAGFKSQIPNSLYYLFVFATMCIAGAGYVINDYFDRKADLINRPGKVVLGRILSRRTGMFWHILLNAVGIGLGTLISYRLGLLKYSMVFIVISGLLWFYSTTYKRQVLLGNLVVAFMVAAVPLLILLYEVPLVLEHYRFLLKSDTTVIKHLTFWIGGYGLFAFLLTLVREIIKDLEDFEGDFAFGRQTIPIAWGAPAAKIIASSLTAISAILVMGIVFLFLKNTLTIAYSTLLITLPLVFSFFALIKADTKEGYHKVSTLLKLTMITGIGYIILAHYFIY